MRIIMIAVIFTAAAAISASTITRGICIEVVDGDTIVVEIEGQPEVFNLAGIDAPELDQAFGEQSRQSLSELVIDKEVDLEILETGSSSQFARIRIGTISVSQEMLAAGMAWTGETESEALILAGMMARGDRLCLWQDDKPVAPSFWRHRKPVLPTPVPVEVARCLADAARKTELRKNADGKAVISGLPMIEHKEAEDGETTAEEKPKDLKYNFQCAKDSATECIKEKFVAKFSEAYEGDGPGTFVSDPIQPGEGQLTAVFQGTSTLGRRYAVGAACTCDDDTCQCVMQFGELEKVQDSSF